ncbi:MAG TPA: hypothetical protein VK638_36660 [Edaphobacter sp.]|nr:hypothetical protein [Edaphobacter sp.]
MGVLIYKFLMLFTLILPLSILAQTPDASSSSSSAPSIMHFQTADAGSSTGTTRTSHHQAPVASFAIHYNYAFQTSPYMGNRSLMGWSVLPEVNLTHHIGFQADFTALTTRGVNVDENLLLIAAGPRYTLAPRSRFTPFIYGEGGEMRSRSSAAAVSNVVDWNPATRAGIGFDLKSKHGIGFEIIPAEYIGEKVEWRDQWNHSFSARAGIVFNLYR